MRHKKIVKKEACWKSCKCSKRKEKVPFAWIPAFLTSERKHIGDIEVFTDRHCPFNYFFANNFLFTCLYNKSPTMC